MRLPFEDGHFHTVYADPPWQEKGGGQVVRGAQKHYQLLKTEDIIALGDEVQRVCTSNAHLYLWTTNRFLPEALQVMEAWGFKYRTCITWVKNQIGLGQYFRGLSEHCLFGVKGNLPYRTREDGKRAQSRTAFYAPKTEHSVKPEEMRRMIELVSYPPYLELFARARAPGWNVWGNEV